MSELHSQRSGMIQNEAEVRGQVRARLSGVGDLYDWVIIRAISSHHRDAEVFWTEG